MLYQLVPELKEITLEDVNAEVLTAGVIDVEELEAVARRFGFAESTVSECLFDEDRYRNSIDAYEDYTFGLVTIVDANNPFHHTDRVAFYFKRNLFLMVSLRDEDGSTNEVFNQALRRYRPEAITLEKVIYAMLEGIIAHDMQALAKLEFEISEMEERVTKNETDEDFNAEIFEKKKELLLLRNYYEQLIDIGDELQENENDIFADGALHYFALFENRADRLSNTVQLLRDSLNQLREAYQAAMDYSLNNIMKILSVVAAIFLPLTLLVGWYGMNFAHMPELEWEYGYPVLIGACVLIVGITLFFFKRKKLF